MDFRILIIGASGTGTTTIGKELSNRLAINHFDLDRFLWIESDPPFTILRNKEEIRELVNDKILCFDNWILSGDPIGWTTEIENKLTLVVFLYAPMTVRINRIMAREKERYGEDILVGGRMYETHKKFIDWTSKYDSGGIIGRTRENQERWLNQLTCPIFRLKTDSTLEFILNEINDEIMKLKFITDTNTFGRNAEN